MKVKFVRFSLTILIGLALAFSLTPIIKPTIDDFASWQGVAHGSPTFALLALLSLAMVIGALARSLATTAVSLIYGRPIINSK